MGDPDADQLKQDHPIGKCPECGGIEFEQIVNPFSVAQEDETFWECTSCHKPWSKSDVERFR
jgi:ssDNA-binding Zn-finger/Zn-ribbon topoisomerase 1